jgi:radical SAM superfamily enzyme YgiQ (UPF0313 family)
MRSPHILMVYPRFNPDSFWNYQATCEVAGARYSAAPLGLITVAAMLPPDWVVRLVNRNTEELSPSDLAWADMVMTGGMLPQQGDTLHVIALAHEAGKPVVVGGTDVSSSPHVYDDAEFRVVGEAEGILDQFIAAWQRGDSGGTFRAEEFPDITTSPVPRFDLLKFEHYMHVGVQVTRGCPFTCEFCNVIELNGRTPRVKTTEQVLGELTALYDLGYRGHVDFVDDNLIGNRRVIKPILKELADWLERHNYPFEFSTEASMNLADDDELLALMKRANFFAVFVGIETPDTAALLGAGKRQNTRRDIVESIRRIYGAGIFVNAGFIIGFDAEKDRMAEPMIACIEDAAIPIAMVGLLYALPNTQLWRRLTEEGRLHANSDRVQGVTVADQCTSGLNFDTVRPRQDMIDDYRTVLRRIYEPRAFFGRAARVTRMLDVSGHRVNRPLRAVLRDLRSFARITWRIGVLDRRSRASYWRAVGDCLLHNPRAARIMVSFAALYLHFGPYSRFLDARMAAQDEGATVTSQLPVRSSGSLGAVKGPLPANG